MKRDRVLEAYNRTKGISCVPKRFGLALRIQREGLTVDAFVTYQDLDREPETLINYIREMNIQLEMELLKAVRG